MLRRIRIAAACFFLILGVGAAYFGLRSYFHIDQLSFHPTAKTSFFVMSGKGKGFLVYRQSTPQLRRIIPEVPEAFKWAQWHDEALWVSDWGRHTQIVGYQQTSRSVILWSSYWLLTLVTCGLSLLLKPAPRYKFGIAEMLLITTMIAFTLGGITLLERLTSVDAIP